MSEQQKIRDSVSFIRPSLTGHAAILPVHRLILPHFHRPAQALHHPDLTLQSVLVSGAFARQLHSARLPVRHLRRFHVSCPPRHRRACDISHGPHVVQIIHISSRKEGCQNPHGWIGRCRQDHDLVQAEARRSCYHNSHDWLQRRVCFTRPVICCRALAVCLEKFVPLTCSVLRVSCFLLCTHHDALFSSRTVDYRNVSRKNNCLVAGMSCYVGLAQDHRFTALVAFLRP